MMIMAMQTIIHIVLFFFSLSYLVYDCRCSSANFSPSSSSSLLVVEPQQENQEVNRSRLWRRQIRDNGATCPLDPSMITPCTCSRNQTSTNGLPEISCINFNTDDNQIPLEDIFERLTDYLQQNDNALEYERLLLVNSKTRQINESMFNGLQFRYLSIYETNLTTVAEDSFTNMQNTLRYLLIKGERLQTIFPAMKQLQVLRTLILNLGVYSFQEIPSGALTDMPQLQRVTINGVANTIHSNAFVNLPSLEQIKITNQLETIESYAFKFNDDDTNNNNDNFNSTIDAITTTSTSITRNSTDNNSNNNSTNLNIDLSNNKLDETSFGDEFIQLQPDFSINLDLTYNWIRYLPEHIFRPFFETNHGNRLQLTNNKFECGRCESYWMIQNESLIRGRIDVNCYMNEQLSMWEYDWSHCDNSSSTDSPVDSAATEQCSLVSVPFLLAMLVIQLYSLFAHQR